MTPDRWTVGDGARVFRERFRGELLQQDDEGEVLEETDDGLRLNATWQMLGMSIDGTMELEIAEPNKHTITRFETRA